MPNPKLEYDARVPAFLQRLKGQYGGPGERQNVQFARPKKQLIDTDDDEPTYLDEHGHENISKEEYEKMTSGEVDEERKRSKTPADERAQNQDSTTSDKEGAEAPNFQKPNKEPRATFGSSKKRKAVKVAGDEDEAKDIEIEATSEAAKPGDEVKSTLVKNQKPKKSKKVKLSFNED